jgi:hypothetical protein
MPGKNKLGEMIMKQEPGKPSMPSNPPEPPSQPAGDPANILEEQVLLTFKRYEDEEFKPIDDCDGVYFISNYGRVVSFKAKEPREIYGYEPSKGKQTGRKIVLVQPGGSRAG